MKFEGCYHGAHDAVLVKAGSGATTLGMPDSLGIPEETTRNTVVIPYNDPAKFEETVKANKDDLAAVIVEPVIGNIGLILPKEGFLEALREATERFEIVLIFDEIITGFRLALGGAQEFYDVRPDLTTLGKILGGGFPMAAFAGKKEIMRLIAPSGKVYQAGTFSGNPVSVAAALATLKLLSKKGADFYKDMAAKCHAVVSPLRRLVEESKVGLQLVDVASMFQVFFTPTPVFDYRTVKTADVARFFAYHAALFKEGVFIPPSQFETCFLSTEHSAEDLKRTVEVLSTALSRVK
jgi:glutamate-1-semialdehyde 2,1-aminomutase